jgi:EutQ-like cupin domain
VISFTDLPYDEHVYVLNGQAVLTSDDGRTDVFTKGDAFVAPKGWTGTWEMRGGYRELICFETRSINDTAKKWWPTLDPHSPTGVSIARGSTVTRGPCLRSSSTPRPA